MAWGWVFLFRRFRGFVEVFFFFTHVHARFAWFPRFLGGRGLREHEVLCLCCGAVLLFADDAKAGDRKCNDIYVREPRVSGNPQTYIFQQATIPTRLPVFTHTLIRLLPDRGPLTQSELALFALGPPFPAAFSPPLCPLPLVQA